MKKTPLIGFMVLIISFIYPVISSAILVEDPTEWAKTAMIYKKAAEQYSRLVQQYNKINDLYKNAQQRLTKAKELVDDNSGNYGWGNFANKSKDLTDRQWSPDNWKSALAGLSGGNKQRYDQLVQQYQNNHPKTLKNDAYKKGASETNNKIYQQQINVNKAASVNASYAFDNIKEHLKKVHDLSMQIEKTKNTKSALDLLARIVTEQSYISVQELKMQTIMNEQVASQQSTTIAAETTSAKFNSLPDK